MIDDWTVTVSRGNGAVRWEDIPAPSPLEALHKALMIAAKQSVSHPALPLMLDENDRGLLMRLLHEALTAPTEVRLTFDQRREGAHIQELLGGLMLAAGDARPIS